MFIFVDARKLREGTWSVDLFYIASYHQRENVPRVGEQFFLPHHWLPPRRKTLPGFVNNVYFSIDGYGQSGDVLSIIE